MGKTNDNVILKLPKGEVLWVRYYDTHENLRYIVTSKSGARDYYYLYEFNGSSFKKLGRSTSPIDLEIKHKIDEEISKP